MTDETLFIAALEKPTPAERLAYLDAACDDPAQRQRLDDLLASHGRAAGVFDHTAELPESMARAGIVQAERAGINQPDRAGIVLAERYKLLEEIGAGGMGTVWVAEQIQPVRRKVAVKLVKAGMDSKSVLARFDAERQALAVMDHPHIAKVLDGGTTEAGRPFFVMEYVKGVPITTYCDDARLSIADRLALFVPVCQAVQHAHQKGIIHRDLKPSNILICLYDGQPVPKVIDFGLAKAMHQPLTEHTLHTAHGLMLGTPLYMSPEQAEFNNLDVDTRTDVYALGVILYELLTGTTPLERDQLRKAAWDEMLRLIREEDPPRPSTRLSGSNTLPSVAAQRQLEPLRLTKLIRGELDWIVMKCLEKNRSRRYDTANGLARDVQRYLADETVEACPPSRGYRLRKFVRHHRGQVVAASAIFLALLAGVIGSSIGLMEAKRQERSAREESALKELALAAEAAERTKAEASAERERKAKEEAETNLALAKKWNKTLGSVFESLDPKANYETVGELSQALAGNLTKAVKELDESASGDPLAVARMQNTLGLSLLGLGDASSAVSVFEKSTATFRNKLGADDLITLTSEDNLGSAYRADRQLKKAISLLESTHIRTKALLGEDDPNTLTNLNNLATTYVTDGQVKKAIPLLEDVLKRRKAKLGPEVHDTLTTMNNLANAYRADGQARKSIPLFEEVLEKRKATLSKDHPSTLATMNNLANAYQDDGQVRKAIDIFEVVLESQKAKLPEGHSRILATMTNLAGAYQENGQVRKAVPLFEAVLEKRKATLSADHPSTLLSMNNLASAYQVDGQVRRAIPLLEAVVEKLKVALPGDHLNVLFALNNLALAYQVDGQVRKAIPLFEEVLEKLKAKLSEDHPRVLGTMSNLANAYRADAKFEKAIPLLAAALEKSRTKQGESHPATLVYLRNLGVTYSQAGQGEKAAATWGQFVDIHRKTAHKDDARFSGILAQASESLVKCQQYATAESMLRECLNIREKKEPNAWTTFDAQSLLGGALLGQKKYTDAEPLLLKGYEGMKRLEESLPPQARVHLPDTADRLVVLYTALENAAAAKKWREERAKYPPAPAPRSK